MFTGELVRLAHIQKDDQSAFKRWYRDYEAMRFTESDAAVPITDEVEEEWYAELVKDNDRYGFSIRTLNDDTLIGVCLLQGIDQRCRHATYSILIGEKDYWGSGYGSDATRIVLRFAFEELNLNRVQLWVYGFNERAIRAYEKCGFVLEGTARQGFYREGHYYDVHLMAVLRQDWTGEKSG